MAESTSPQTHSGIAELFRSITHENRAAHFLLSGSGEIVSANRAGVRLLGRDGNGIIGTNLVDFVDEPEDRVRTLLNQWSSSTGSFPGRLTIHDDTGQPCLRNFLGARLKFGSRREPHYLILRCPTDDEKSALFLRLNSELDELHRWEKEIRRERGELENFVELRTAELNEANKKLELEVLERRRTESRWRDSEESISAILRAAADVIITIDEAGIVKLVNQAAENVFGYSADEIIGENVSMLVPSPHCEKHDDYMKRYLETGMPPIIGVRREVAGIRKDGHVLPMDLVVSAVRLGKKRMFIGILRDLSEKRQLEVQLNQAQKLESIGQLASGIAHEINTPSQYVMDNIHFLQKAFGKLLHLTEQIGNICEDGHNELSETYSEICRKARLPYLMNEIPKAFEQADEGLHRIADIVLAMKEFAHPGSVDKKDVNLSVLLENMIAVCRNEWKYVADLHTDFAPDMPMVPGLANELNQVFLNMIVNAAHAIEGSSDARNTPKGEIRISTYQENGSAVVQIADTGGGIPKEVQTRIFDPFFTTKEVGKGSGQGLAISHSVIVDKHSGRIECESEVDKGTTFRIYLPLDVEDIDGLAAKAGASAV